MSDLHIGLRMVGSKIWMGGVHYIQSLAYAIASLPREEKGGVRVSLSVPAPRLDLAEPIRSYIDHVYAEQSLSRAYLKVARILAEYLPYVPFNLLNLRKYDFVYPEFAGLRAPYAWGAWITDFQHFHMPQFFSQTDIDRRNAVFKKFAQAAPVIVLSSQMAQEDFCSLFPQYGQKSRVLNFASWIEPKYFEVDPQITRQSYGLPDDFFLVCNQFWKHKDHEVVFEALGLLKRQGIYPIVVCTGNTSDERHPEYFEQLQLKIECLGIGKQIIILGLIPRFDQIQLMRKCLAVLQPSLFEGWSTVVEDARALGKTILLSDFPTHVEQNPPFSFFFQRRNAEELASLISTVLFNSRPGPNLERETLARQENIERLRVFGNSFIKMVREVLTKGT